MGSMKRRKNCSARFIITTTIGAVFGFFVGVSFPSVSLDRIYVPTNPLGAESLPPGIVVPETDLYPRRLWGDPSEDLMKKPKYLATFTVGIDQMVNIDKCVKKFSEDFQILLFHYDGRTTEWDLLEWSKNAVHVSASKQTKWWYAKRYIKLVKKHGLEISQPGLEPNYALTWQMTKRRNDGEVHKFTKEKPGWCSDPRFPACAAFVEIMAPVFSREAWRCVWYLIQNDLVHGWGLDFALRRCVTGEPHAGISPRDAVRIRCKIEWAMFQKRIADADLAYITQLTNAKG
ncbi:T6D22.12 isoform 4 [Hibiscus syriacus]|uniref:T6D22.12 isoform 4 n=1 Tax=Hibiscus syriacus TaxID=106335 RepID=A0A6A2XFE5_HIBSY|nr:T6D22.12 isoform 4 [Hibiscus syriacus]